MQTKGFFPRTVFRPQATGSETSRQAWAQAARRLGAGPLAHLASASKSLTGGLAPSTPAFPNSGSCSRLGSRRARAARRLREGQSSAAHTPAQQLHEAVRGLGATCACEQVHKGNPFRATGRQPGDRGRLSSTGTSRFAQEHVLKRGLRLRVRSWQQCAPRAHCAALTHQRACRTMVLQKASRAPL